MKLLPLPFIYKLLGAIISVSPTNLWFINEGSEAKRNQKIILLVREETRIQTVVNRFQSLFCKPLLSIHNIDSSLGQYLL